jgi:dihydroorotate dehydrogenase
MIDDIGAAALRLVEPETAHRLALAALRAGLAPRRRDDRFASLRTTLAGLALPNPIGLAAGFDKDCLGADALLGVGFGLVECGTVTPHPQPGNARPRLFRLREDRAVINRMGFNNQGLDAFVARLATRKRAGIVGANVGANKDSADRIGDYVLGLSRVWRHASYIAINISSPNTPGLRDLQEKGPLQDLLGQVNEARAEAAARYGQKPVFLKVAPDLDEAAIEQIATLAVAAKIDALIVSNTTIDRPPTLASVSRAEAGGLSGRPLFEKSTRVLAQFARALAGRAALIGVGGVEDGATALAKIKAGASAVQVYSALVFAGPGLIGRIAADLAARLASEGFADVSAAIGAGL